MILKRGTKNENSKPQYLLGTTQTERMSCGCVEDCGCGQRRPIRECNKPERKEALWAPAAEPEIDSPRQKHHPASTSRPRTANASPASTPRSGGTDHVRNSCWRENDKRHGIAALRYSLPGVPCNEDCNARQSCAAVQPTSSIALYLVFITLIRLGLTRCRFIAFSSRFSFFSSYYLVFCFTARVAAPMLLQWIDSFSN